jgi:uncharacterized protein YcnI
MSFFSVPRLAAVGGVAALAVFAVAGPAAAHVTANPSTAPQGSYTKISFRVPNEQETAHATQVEVDLPLDHPIASVSVRPVPGWTIQVTKGKLPKPITSDDGEITQAVTKIVWTKGSIDPGQFQEFDVSMGPLPTDVDQISFKAVQTYDSGQVVNWDQPVGADGKEPDHPAPVVHLTKASNPSGGKAGKAAKAKSAAKADDRTARTLGTAGLVVGVIGLGVGGFSLARGRGRS